MWSVTRRVVVDDPEDLFGLQGRYRSWPMRLRRVLLLPWSCWWNAWVRDATARLEHVHAFEFEANVAGGYVERCACGETQFIPQ